MPGCRHEHSAYDAADCDARALQPSSLFVVSGVVLLHACCWLPRELTTRKRLITRA